MAKTTKAHFAIFKSECEKWIEIFGLKGWQLFFAHERLGGFLNAATSWSLAGRHATFYLFPEMEDLKATNENCRLLAFHEVCELFIGPLSTNAGARFIREHEIRESTHAIIATLQNVLYPKY